MKRTDCKNCLLLGRTEPKVRCPTCHYCKEHAGCHCVNCSICKKRVAPTDICTRCQKCRKHHVEIIHGDFPFRKCEYTDTPVIVRCACREYDTFIPCKGCGKCPRHGCICPPSFAINPLQRTIGCELEIADYGSFDQDMHMDIPIMYTYDHDGSVRPSQRELVTGRLLGDKVPIGMGALADVLVKHKASVNETCGFHVHVDALRDTPADLRRIMVAFKLFQDQIFGNLVAAERKDNQYCPPLALDDSQIFDLMKLESSGDINNWFHRYLYRIVPDVHSSFTPAQRKAAMRDFESQLQARKAHKYENNARRSAINFHSWMMRGTVEFRLKEGSVSKPDLVNWPLWCGWFVQKIAGLPDKEILWWMKKPPTLVELTERFTASSLGGARMPKSILEWVAACCSGEAKPRLKKKPLEAITEWPERQPIGVEATFAQTLQRQSLERAFQQRAAADLPSQRVPSGISYNGTLPAPPSAASNQAISIGGSGNVNLDWNWLGTPAGTAQVVRNRQNAEERAIRAELDRVESARARRDMESEESEYEETYDPSDPF